MLLCPWDFPGKNTGEDHHFSFQGIFSIQGLNLHLLHCRQILYHLVNREAKFVTSSNLSPKCMLDYKHFSAPVLLVNTAVNLLCSKLGCSSLLGLTVPQAHELVFSDSPLHQIAWYLHTTSVNHLKYFKPSLDYL